MTAPRRIAVYDDAYVFGGHELMLARLLRGLREAGDIEVLVLLSPENRRHAEAQGLTTSADGRFRVEYLPFSTPRHLGNLAVLLLPHRVAHVLRRLQAFRPDRVLVAQGGIDISTTGLLASRLGGWRTVSYIPNLNGYARANPTRKNRIRDRLNRPFHRLPHAYVVIRKGDRDTLARRGFRGPTQVVYNAVDARGLARLPRSEARARLGLDPEAYAVGLIGRIDLDNKGHGLLAEAARKHPDAFAGAQLVVVGEGPDEARLRALLETQGLKERFRILPFRKDLSEIYSALDLVAIPSRSEGVPLVMLEAMHYGLPVVASAVDGMLEMLPPAWLFPPGDAGALADRIGRLRKDGGGPALDECRRRLLEQSDPLNFLQSFREALGLSSPAASRTS